MARSSPALFCRALAVCLLAGCIEADLAPMPDTYVFSHHESPESEVREYSGFRPIIDGGVVDRGLVMLGKRLFHDPRLSKDNTVACASCHVIAAGGDDGRSVSVGVGGARGTLNAPTVFNSAGNFRQFWDGRARDLKEQVAVPIHNPLEMASDWESVIAKLSRDVALLEQFRLNQRSLTPEAIVEAIVAYENALLTPDAPFDRWLLGEEDALTDEAHRGRKLFVELGCVSCHQGRNVGGNMFQRFGVFRSYYEDRDVDVQQASFGRFNVTGKDRDRYVFKVPSLRNVAETAPYFHDGSVATLREAIEIMAEYQLGRELAMADVESLESFLRSLSGHLDEALL